MPRPKKQHLKRQKDGRYFCKAKDGKMISGRTEDEALEKRKAYERSLEVGLTPCTMTVGEYAEYWLPIYKAGIKSTTYNGYCSVLTKGLAPIGGIFLSDLTTDDLAKAYAAIAGKSTSYISKLRILVTEMLDSAVDAGYIRTNIARSRSIKPPKGTSGTHRTITAGERTRIDQTQHRMQIAALIMLYCGLRRGEVIGLQAGDISGNSLTVRRAVYYVGNQPQISEPKTANSIRTVPAPDTLLLLMPKMNRDCYVLTGTKKPMTEMAFTRAWESYQKALASDVRCHDLRHSYCTWLRDKGIDIHQAIIWMGHADEKMILRVYDHPGSERETESKKLFTSALRLQNGLQIPEQPAQT